MIAFSDGATQYEQDGEGADHGMFDCEYYDEDAYVSDDSEYDSDGNRIDSDMYTSDDEVYEESDDEESMNSHQHGSVNDDGRHLVSQALGDYEYIYDAYPSVSGDEQYDSDSNRISDDNNEESDFESGDGDNSLHYACINHSRLNELSSDFAAFLETHHEYQDESADSIDYNQDQDSEDLALNDYEEEHDSDSDTYQSDDSDFDSDGNSLSDSTQPSLLSLPIAGTIAQRRAEARGDDIEAVRRMQLHRQWYESGLRQGAIDRGSLFSQIEWNAGARVSDAAEGAISPDTVVPAALDESDEMHEAVELHRFLDGIEHAMAAERRHRAQAQTLDPSQANTNDAEESFGGMVEYS